MFEDSIVEHQRQYKAERPTLKVRMGRCDAQSVSFRTSRSLSLFL